MYKNKFVANGIQRAPSGKRVGGGDRREMWKVPKLLGDRQEAQLNGRGFGSLPAILRGAEIGYFANYKQMAVEKQAEVAEKAVEINRNVKDALSTAVIPAAMLIYGNLGWITIGAVAFSGICVIAGLFQLKTSLREYKKAKNELMKMDESGTLLKEMGEMKRLMRLSGVFDAVFCLGIAASFIVNNLGRMGNIWLTVFVVCACGAGMIGNRMVGKRLKSIKDAAEKAVEGQND